MTRVEIWACSEDADRLSGRLLRQKCLDVDVVPLTEGITERYDSSADARDAQRSCERIERALGILAPFMTGKKKNLRGTDADGFVEDGGAEKARKIVDAVIADSEKLSELNRSVSDLESSKAALAPWIELEIPLDKTRTGSTEIFTGSFPARVTEAEIERACEGLDYAMRKISGTSAASYYLFVVYADDSAKLLRALTHTGFARIDLSGVPGRASEGYAACDAEIERLETEREEISGRLAGYAADAPSLRILWDVEMTRFNEAEMRRRMAQTDNCVMLAGWVPSERRANVEKLLASEDVAYEFRDPVPGEKVPVALQNNFFARNFEWVIAMYSLPEYGTYDPTFIMAIWYCILFAMMFADVGYGLVLVLGGFLLPKILHLRESTKRAFNMFAWCGVASILSGVLFGGWFSDLPTALMKAFSPEVTPPETLALVVDPVKDPMTFMIIGFAVGFLHLVTGQAISFAIAWKKNKFDAVCDHVFYWVIYVGIILLIAAPAPYGYIVAGAGALAVILTAGRKEKNPFMRLPKGFLGLYGLVNFGSDVISYSRILAIALSGAVLGSVFNILATMSDGIVFRIIAMPIILIVGHLLNVALSALSAFVHTSRLQYVEFFGKFYTDGGRPYDPFIPSGKFIGD